MTVLTPSDIPSLSLLYKLRKLSPAPPHARLPATLHGPSTRPAPSKSLNDRLCLLRCDITTLSVDAIVNAANKSLLGGGGVDGAIHRAAGPRLLAECQKLGGCATGSAVITDAYNLPCRRVIHAVGPVYDPLDPTESERLLAGCYTRSLELAAQHGCRSVAFSAISTGVYGYPSREAAPVALSAVRKFLVGPEGDKIDQVVIVTFERKDVEAYHEFLPLYFPPVAENEFAAEQTTETAEQQENEAELEAEAEAVASELPSAPTSDPSDMGHTGKKQRHGND